MTQNQCRFYPYKAFYTGLLGIYLIWLDGVEGKNFSWFGNNNGLAKAGYFSLLFSIATVFEFDI